MEIVEPTGDGSRPTLAENHQPTEGAGAPLDEGVAKPEEATDKPGYGTALSSRFRGVLQEAQDVYLHVSDLYNQLSETLDDVDGFLAEENALSKPNPREVEWLEDYHDSVVGSLQHLDRALQVLSRAIIREDSRLEPRDRLPKDCRLGALSYSDSESD